MLGVVNIIISVKGDTVVDLSEADEIIVLDTVGRAVKHRTPKPFNIDLIEDVAEEYGAEILFAAGLPAPLRELLEEAGIKIVLVGKKKYMEVVDELFL